MERKPIVPPKDTTAENLKKDIEEYKLRITQLSNENKTLNGLVKQRTDELIKERSSTATLKTQLALIQPEKVEVVKEVRVTDNNELDRLVVENKRLESIIREYEKGDYGILTTKLSKYEKRIEDLGNQIRIINQTKESQAQLIKELEKNQQRSNIERLQKEYVLNDDPDDSIRDELESKKRELQQLAMEIGKDSITPADIEELKNDLFDKNEAIKDYSVKLDSAKRRMNDLVKRMNVIKRKEFSSKLSVVREIKNELNDFKSSTCSLIKGYAVEIRTLTDSAKQHYPSLERKYYSMLRRFKKRLSEKDDIIRRLTTQRRTVRLTITPSSEIVQIAPTNDLEKAMTKICRYEQIISQQHRTLMQLTQN